MSSDDYSTDEDRHHKHYTTERKTPQLSTITTTTSTDRLSPLPHNHHNHHHSSKRHTPSRTPVATPSSPPYLYSSSDTDATDTDTDMNDNDNDTDDSTTSSLSPASTSSTAHTPRQPPSPSFLYDRTHDRPSAPLLNEATPLLPTAQPASSSSSLRSVFTASAAVDVEGEEEGGVGGELVSFMVGVDMELSVFVLRVVCVVLASVAIVSVSAEFTTWHVLLTAPVVIFALAAFFNANSSSKLLRHVSRADTFTPPVNHPCTLCVRILTLCDSLCVFVAVCGQLLIACTVLCVLELANIVVCVLLFSLTSFTHLWYDTAVTATLVLVLVLLIDNKRTRDRLTTRYIKQYTADKQRRTEQATVLDDEADTATPAGGQKGYGGRRWSDGGVRGRSLSVDEEERRERVGGGGREKEGGVDGVGGVYEKQHKPVSILEILQPSKDDGSEASMSPV